VTDISDLSSTLNDMKVLAVVSGKGGSGKTLFVTTLMLELDRNDIKVILVDGDLGTGGASYFLGLDHVRSIQIGLTEILTSFRRPLSKAPRRGGREDLPANLEPGSADSAAGSLRASRSRIGSIVERALQPIKGTKHAKLLPIGSTIDPLDETPDTYEKLLEQP